METTPASSRSKAKTLGAAAIVALVLLLVVINMRRVAAEKQLAQLSVRLEQLNGGNQAQNREAAQRIVEQVRRLYAIPADTEPTVATIVDVEALRARNPFYNKAKNGDYLIVTADRAILFDAVASQILDVVPVQIDAPSSAVGR
jgi:hypothetical protein